MLLAVKVLLPLPLPPFSFLLPFELSTPKLGCRVVVPWQGGIRIGLVSEIVELSATKGLELKEMIAVLDEEPFVLPDRLEFLKALALYSCAPTGSLLANLLPTGLNDQLIHEVKRQKGVKNVELPEAEWLDASKVAVKTLEFYRKQGLIKERIRPVQKTIKVLKALRPVDEDLLGKAKAWQRSVLERLWQCEYVESAAKFARDTGVSESTVRTLIKKGYAGYEEISAPPVRLPLYPPLELEADKRYFDQNKSELFVYGATREKRLACLLPYINKDLQKAGSVLILLPEGALIPETASYLSAHFPTYVFSGTLSDEQRKRLWSELSQSEACVLVGSYLALLAPLKDLARIVVLEEASSSYKLPAGARLFIPSVAQRLADQIGANMGFTDSLARPETFTNASSHVINLPYPAQRIHVTDLSQSRNWPLSSDLVLVLKQVKERSRQAVILAPRRGFSAALGCSQCNYIAMCPNCDLSLRYHQNTYSLRCHQCGYKAALPDICPSCDTPNIKPMRGAGTEWVAKEVAKFLGEFPLYHYEADRKDDLSPLLEAEPGIVIATTAIFRHAPLPKISLIALTLLDTHLTMSDFRAEEETMRLLLQLAELSSASRPLVLLQTMQKDHPVMAALTAEKLDEGIEAFMHDILERRKRFKYPPFGHIVKIQVSAKDKMTVQKEAEWLAKALDIHLAGRGEILGPSPAPIARLRGQFSFQIFVRTAVQQELNQLIEPALAYRGRAKVRIDVEPRDIGEYLT